MIKQENEEKEQGSETKDDSKNYCESKSENIINSSRLFGRQIALV